MAFSEAVKWSSRDPSKISTGIMIIAMIRIA